MHHLVSVFAAASVRARAVAAAASLLSAVPACAQGRAVVPPFAATLPGNAAISQPLRWSQGVLQVCMTPVLLPPNFVGQQIRGVRMRRPALLGEPAYPATQRTLTVRACFTPNDPVSLFAGLVANRPANLQVVAGPAVFPVAATAPASGAQPLGAEFLVIPFAQPLPVTAGNLFLEFEAGDAPLAIGEQWVDAVWIRDGIDHGYVAPIGDGACTTGATPLQLAWTADDGPLRGRTAELQVTGAPPGATMFAFAGLAPQLRAPGPVGSYLGFGASLGVLDTALAGCFQWSPLDALFFGTADAAGTYTVSFTIPTTGVGAFEWVGVQAGFVDVQRPGLLLSITNGEMLIVDTAGINNRCASVFFPGAATTSPWGTFYGLTPVLVLDL